LGEDTGLTLREGNEGLMQVLN